MLAGTCLALLPELYKDLDVCSVGASVRDKEPKEAGPVDGHDVRSHDLSPTSVKPEV
jgi:hypothetical protein